jgi:glucosamine--fructose-6-phosphate aminotransferase (isomerizing)
VHNAHPHFSHGSGAASQARPGKVALVHNGIIENYEELRAGLKAKGYVFESQTDTEVIVHLMDSLYDGDLFEALKATVAQLHGAYAIAAFCKDEPHRVVGARAGSPLILGVGKDKTENFLASDAMALAGVTDQIVYLEEGDMVDIQLGKYWIVGKGRQARAARRQDRAGPQRRRRARPLPPLHAERNLRAAARHCRHARRR